MNKKIAIIGLGKMGSGFARNAKNHSYEVIGFDPKLSNQDLLKQIKVTNSLQELVNENGKKGIYLLSIPHGEPTRKVIESLLHFLDSEAIIIDTGNNKWQNTEYNKKMCDEKNVYLFDVGTSGGPSGALNGACFMIGGDENIFKKIEYVFKDLAQEDGYLYVGKSGAGHFSKMVHNGIEYGMMQALAEGFAILEKSKFGYDLEQLAKLWNSGSVIRSWLVELLVEVFKKENKKEFDQTLPIVGATGEAKWTIEAALELDVPAPVIALSLMLRQQSDPKNKFSNQVLSQLRNKFGGHEVVKK